MSYNPNGPKARRFESAKKRKLFLNSALRSDARPISLEALEALKVEGQLPTKVFTENIGVIFPLVLDRLSLGESIPVIERVLGLKLLVLTKMIQRNPRLKEACNEARKIKNDRVINPPQ